MKLYGTFNHIIYFRFLFNQFLLDMYAKIETEKLNYIRYNQQMLRTESYIHFKNAVSREDVDASKIGQMEILSSYFHGGPR